MLSNRSHTLVGERWPKPGLEQGIGNRNNIGVPASGGQPSRAGSGRTVQERAGSVDTRLTQQTEKPFAACSTPYESAAGRSP